ncbi:hypothetical protein KDA23_06000, partial [Candidatus Saccharibacteria bacterium]|nr:hypothetical protein [Candidatus Saccharibacteria bacterium]
FSFTDAADEPLTTLTPSDIIQISGLVTGADISISGDGTPQYRVCTDGSSSTNCDGSEVQTWTATTGIALVQNNHYVQVRLTSNAANSTMNSATLNIGGVTDQWDVTTINDITPNAFNFTDKSGVTASTLIVSDIVQIFGIDTGVDISVSGDGSPEYRICSDGSSPANCDGSETQTWTSLPLIGVVNNNEYVQLRLTANASAGATNNATLTVGGTNDTWAVTTYTPNDNTPDAFDFIDMNDIALSTQTASDIVQITGIDVAVDLSISGGGSPEFRVCTDGSSEANCDGSETQTWTAGPVVGAVVNNDYVQVRLTSSVSNSTTLQTTLNVGTESANWDVTTENDT